MDARSATAAPKKPMDGGIRLITTYKLAKGIGQLVLALVLFATVELGLAVDWLHEAVFFARHHFASATSVKLAELLMGLATPKHLGLTALALALDGALTTAEGSARGARARLHRKRDRRGVPRLARASRASRAPREPRRDVASSRAT
jgi:hypothetical protein